MNVLHLIEEDEERVPEERETHPTGGRRITGKTTVSGEDPDQMRCHEPRVVSGDGKRPRLEKEAAPGDTTDTTEDAHRETPSDGCAGPGTTSSARRRLLPLSAAAAGQDW